MQSRAEQVSGAERERERGEEEGGRSCCCC